MPRTRVLFLISSLAQGGAERHLVDLAGSLDPERWDPEICVRTPIIHYQSELPDGQPRYSLASRLWCSPAALARMVSVIREFRPHILHTYMNDANLWGRLAACAARAPKPRVITSVHVDDMPLHYRWLERRLARRTDQIVAHSRSMEELLVQRLGVPADRVTVIPNGVDEQAFQPPTPQERSTARQSHGFASDQLVALMPARIAPQKNQDLVVAALGRLRAAGALPPSFRLLLAGRVSSPGYDRQVRAAVDRAGLQAQVVFLGPVAELRPLYAAVDVVLMPSRTEASPIAALEALACGVPVPGRVRRARGGHGWSVNGETVIGQKRT